MTTSAFPSQLAYFPEVTQGTPPVNGAAWVAGGRRIRHIASVLDPAGLQQSVVEDERSQTRVFAHNTKVKGLRGVQQPVGLYLTGSGAVTADGDQIAETDLMTILEHALGGLHRSNSTVLDGGGHTTTVINVEDATNIIEGCLIAVSDTSAGTPPVVRRVLDVSTLAITLDEALPFTPVDDDVVHGMATAYIDETVLVDSNGSGGPFTFSWLVQKGLPNALENWQLQGCKLQLDSLSLPRGELPSIAGTIFAASFERPGVAPSPTWTAAPSGSAPVSIGPNCEIQLQTVGTTTANHVQVSEFSVSIGVPVVPIETVTEVDNNMEGIAAYCTQPADTMITMGIVPMASSHWADFDADTFKLVRWTKLASPGQIFTIQASNCEIAAQPKRGVQNASSRVDLELRAHAPAEITGASNQALVTSKILIGVG